MGLKLILIYNIIYYFGVGDYNNLTNLNSYVFFCELHLYLFVKNTFSYTFL